MRRLETGAELIGIGLYIGEGQPGDSLLGGGLSHRRGHRPENPGIERLGNQVVTTKPEPHHLVRLEDRLGYRLAGEIGQRPRCRYLHPFAHTVGSDVEGPSKDEWEAKNIVDLVGKVAPTGSDNCVRAGGPGGVISDLGIGVGQREDERVGSHGFDHLLLYRPSHRYSNEGIGTTKGIGQGPCRGCPGELGLDRCQVVTFGMDHSPAVDHQCVVGIDPKRVEEAGGGDAGRTCTGEHHPHLLDRFCPPVRRR